MLVITGSTPEVEKLLLAMRPALTELAGSQAGRRVRPSAALSLKVRSLSDRTIRIFPDQNSVKILSEFKKI